MSRVFEAGFLITAAVYLGWHALGQDRARDHPGRLTGQGAPGGR